MRKQTSKSSRQQGADGETLAARFLERNGMRILERNYRYHRGEIDMIADDGGELVFVEVKTRRSTTYGEPEEAVTPRKQEQLRAIAEGYLAERGIENTPCRFDVVAILRQRDTITIKHVKDAF
jgi:putative endonuclease